jgi:hypothetical protein
MKISQPMILLAHTPFTRVFLTCEFQLTLPVLPIAHLVIPEVVTFTDDDSGDFVM